MSKLIEHVKRECELAGLFKDDGDYGPMLGDAALELTEIFANQKHSGFSAGMLVAILEKVWRYKTLTPITSDPKEWKDVSEMMGKPCWQNKRCTSCFSSDGGKTWTDNDEVK